MWHDVDDQNRPRRGGVAPEDAVRAGRAVLGIRLEHLAAVRAQITVPLVRSMPPKRVLELMLTGRRVSAAEAERIGFVNRVVPVAELDSAVDELAASLAAKSPAIVKLGRDSFYAVWDQAAEEALRLLHPMLTLTTLTEDSREGIAAFAEKRKPVWKGQ